MDTNAIKIGTITAHYNNYQYLGDCVKGLVEQTQKPDYIVIIDDNSDNNPQDEIPKIITNLNGQFINGNNWKINDIDLVLFFKEKRGGPAATRNIGLKYLIDKTNIIVNCDSDDIFYSEKIEKSVKIMKKYDQVGEVYSDFDILDVKNQTTSRNYCEPFSYIRLWDECIASNNCVMSTEVIKKVGLYEEDLFGPEDYSYHLRIAEMSAVYHIPEALYLYRLTGGNLTTTTKKEQFAHHVQIVKQRAVQRRNQNVQLRS